MALALGRGVREDLRQAPLPVAGGSARSSFRAECDGPASVQMRKNSTRRPLRRVGRRIWRLSAPMVARMIWYLGPANRAQERAYAVARKIEAAAILLLGRSANNWPYLRFGVMNDLICQFSCLSPGSPLNFDVVGDTSLARRVESGEAILFATIHSRLGLAANAALRSRGRGPLVVGNPPTNLRANSWGSADLLSTIDAQSATVFLKIRSALRDNRSVVTFVDYGVRNRSDRFVSPNLFEWAERANVALAYMMCSLGEDGQIILELAPEPPGKVGVDAKSQAFTEFVETRTQRRFDICRPKDMQVP